MTWVQKSKRGRLSPFPNHLSFQAVTSIMKDICGYKFEKTMIIFQDRMAYFCQDDKDIKRVEILALEKAKQDSTIMTRLVKTQEKIGQEMVDFAKSTHDSNLKSKSNKELFELYKEFCEKYKKVYAAYFVILSMENVLGDFLKDYLRNKIMDEDSVSRIFSILTTATTAMYPKEEEKDLNKIAFDIVEKKLTKEEIDKKIEEHTKKYFWLTRDYEDDVLTEKDFREKLEDIIKTGKVKEKLEETEEFYKKKKQDIENAEKDIDEYHKRLFELLRKGIHLKELRKKFVSLSMYYMDSLLREIGQRTGLTLKQVRFLVVEDIEDILLKNKKIDIDERIKLSVYLIEDGKTIVYDGQEAEKIRKDIIKIDENLKELKGLPVSNGKAKGPAKIVFDPQDITKVKQGDIMVTVQAVPSFSSGIKIAGALLADGGTGITSHPATLAREAGIPCVTGLKVATDIIKDGDMIEVDGNTGVVRLI